jgi:hypothetical protein
MTHGTIVLLHGTVTGTGRVAGCEVLARKIIAEENGGQLPRPYDFTDCSVIGAPSDLPDGEYAIRFEGYSFTAACLHGIWFSRSPATKVSPVTKIDATDAQLADTGHARSANARDAA